MAIDRERTMQRSSAIQQAGFSLIELMVAMTITVVISGAVYGLIAGGQNAFRREPELAERQQNARMAMDVVLRDIANAGSGLPTFTQTFSTGLNACAGCPDGGAPVGPDGAVTDELEILTNSGLRDTDAVCRVANGDRGDDGTSLQLVRRTTDITPGTVLMLMMDDGTWTVRTVTAVATAQVVADNCLAVNHVLLDFAAGGMNANHLCLPSVVFNPPAPAVGYSAMGSVNAPCDVMEVARAEVVRYRIRPAPDGIPVLQRSSSANAGAGFQTIARGIEGFQVQYITAALDPTDPINWVDNAPAVGLPEAVGPPGANPWQTVITQVRVTLTARSEAQNVAGGSTAAAGPTVMRGVLTATASPRSSLQALTRQPVPAPPLPPPHLWR